MNGVMDTDALQGYVPIEDYGLIGDMHTCALVSKSGSIDFMCWPVFDSPTIFGRLLDKNKGGYFLVNPEPEEKAICKQSYAPYTNIIDTKWIREEGVVNVLDFFPFSGTRTSSKEERGILTGKAPTRDSTPGSTESPEFQSGLVRKVTCTSGSFDMVAEIFPAFNYALDKHRVVVDRTDSKPDTQTIVFQSETQTLHVDIFVDNHGTKGKLPELQMEVQDGTQPGQQGVVVRFPLYTGQLVTFVAHSDQVRIPDHDLHSYFRSLEMETYAFWSNWTRKCTFRGHYRERVERSLMTLKLLTYKPTGAIIASPTFSLPEGFGGSRNWDYRYSWIRDTSFVLYVFLENGYSEEAEAYMSFVYDNAIPCVSSRVDGSNNEQLLPIVLTIRGEVDIPEKELSHLEGYRGSRPVRIGNGATSHIQLDSFGALLDSIYLYNKFAGPISYERWLEVRRIINHLITLRNEPDMSIWEVRGQKRNFVFSKIMLWVAIDRALRLSEKRSNLPCPERFDWLTVRDGLYEEIMDKGYNREGGFFCMSYEDRDVLDSSLLMAPLLLFLAPDDPRILSTMNNIMKSPEEGGLMSANMIYRYDHTKVKDGMFVPTDPIVPDFTRLTINRRRRQRRKIHHGHLLAGRSNEPCKFYP